MLAVVWLAIAAPIVVGARRRVDAARLGARSARGARPRGVARRGAADDATSLAADGSRLAELPFRDGGVVGHRTLVDARRAAAAPRRRRCSPPRTCGSSSTTASTTARSRAPRGSNYQAGRVVEGASTITQQVARNLLPDEIGNERSVRRKVREALLARAIERRWTKREILEVYLDFVFLGQGAYGMAAAARAYFDRDVGELDLAQAALLAGLIQAPSRLDPFHHPEAARARRDEVLARMARANLIDEATRARAAATPIDAARDRDRATARACPGTPSGARSSSPARFPTSAARGGLVDRDRRAAGARHAAAGRRRRARRALEQDAEPQIAALVWDHRTGYVEALVGGRAWGAGSLRSHAAELPPAGLGVEAARLRRRARGRRDHAGHRAARCADRRVRRGHERRTGSRSRAIAFRGVVLAQDAFAASLNAPAIDVFDRVGRRRRRSRSRAGSASRATLAEVRPMALGASCVKPIELARAYAIIARRGWAVAPRFAVRVRRGDDVLFDAAVPEDPWLDPARRFDRLAATAGARSRRAHRRRGRPAARRADRVSAAAT